MTGNCKHGDELSFPYNSGSFLTKLIYIGWWRNSTYYGVCKVNRSWHSSAAEKNTNYTQNPSTIHTLHYKEAEITFPCISFKHTTSVSHRY